MSIRCLTGRIRGLALGGAGLALIAWFGTAPLFAQQIQLRAIQVRQGVEVNEGEEEPDEEENPRPQDQNFFIEESNFENWIWQGSASTVEGGRDRLQTMLDIELADIVQTCQLDEAQQRKLQLAGRLDIQRFLDRYQKLRLKFLKIRTDQNAMNAFWGELAPVQQEIQSGLFANGSLFRGVIAKSLSSEQRQSYEAASLARRKYRMEAKLELLLVAADEGLAMRAEQRERLRELCLANLKPARRHSPYDTHVVMYQLSLIPEAKLAEFLNERQLKFWKQSIAQFAANGGMIDFLKNNGVWPDDLEIGVSTEPGPTQPAEEEVER